jgi:hypothetical protein
VIYCLRHQGDNESSEHLGIFIVLQSTAVIANRMPAGTEVPAKDFVVAREDFFFYKFYNIF